MDLKKKRLVDATTYQSARLRSTRAIVPHLDAISVSTDPYNLLLANFPEITTPNFMQSPTRHGVQHFIATKGPPVHARARRLPPDKLAIAKAEFDRMEKMGIVRKSSSPWASPLHMVPKATGVGVHAETIGDIMMSLYQTDIQSPTSRIFRPI